MSSMSGHPNELAAYRNSPAEIARTRDLLAIVPKNLSSVLDVGARDGHFSRLLTEHFESVTALDLTMPQLDFDRVRPVQGDVTKLQFPDDNFDVAFCAEVLEHVPALQKACSEIERVARHAVMIGVPFSLIAMAVRSTQPRVLAVPLWEANEPTDFPVFRGEVD